MIPRQQRPGVQDLAEALGEVAARVRRLGGLLMGHDPSSAGCLRGVSGRENAVGGYGWARALGDAEVLGCRTDAGEVLLTITGVLHPWLPPLQVSVAVWVGADDLVAPGTPPYEDRPVPMAALRRLAQAPGPTIDQDSRISKGSGHDHDT